MIEIDLDNVIASNIGSIEIEDEDYFKLPAVSASILKRLINDEAYEVANQIETKVTPAMTFGSLVHCMILEPTKLDKRYAAMPKCDLRTKEGKAQKASFEIMNDKKTIVSEDYFETAKRIYESVCENGINKLFTGGVAEQAYISQFGDIEVKGKLDYYIEKKGLILDVKTTVNAGDDFVDECGKRLYSLQASFYIDLLNSLGKKAHDFIFVGIQSVFPHKITLVRMNDIELEFGREAYKVALDIWKDIQENPSKYKSKLCINPRTDSNIWEYQTPTYMHYKIDRLKKINAMY